MNRKPKNLGGMHPSVLRRINSIAVFHTLRKTPHISQRDIGLATGIDRSTVSAITGYFDSLGLLERHQPEEQPVRRGRPMEALTLRAEAGLLIGVHILPEKVRFVASGLDGVPKSTRNVLPLREAADFGESVEAGLETFLQTIGRKRDEVSAIGVTVPGLVANDGRLAESSNMRWRDLDLQGALVEQFGPNVWLNNDSRAAGIAEKMFGRCAEANDFVFVDSASGVGGSLFLDGAPYAGAGGFAGELGHIKVVPNGRLCTCGCSGCLSAYLSEPALVRRFAQLELNVEDFSQMRALAENGVAAALSALDEAGEMLGLALANYINLFNPEMIALGGGIASLMPFLEAGMERTVSRHALASARALCTIVVSDLAREETPRGGLALALGGLTDTNSGQPFPW
ncbi:ROK family transcriptional regulator [uncultured Martelella sp.]|uniref:ROK family transcriptional regulator n=1 Tax=uncultured Martelella sp. TaxID=392331 RepID=UPI0029C8EC7D|nr:ROK family transcriptional regulator [uncultured Martelella sp.]